MNETSSCVYKIEFFSWVILTVVALKYLLERLTQNTDTNKYDGINCLIVSLSYGCIFYFKTWQILKAGVPGLQFLLNKVLHREAQNFTKMMNIKDDGSRSHKATIPKSSRYQSVMKFRKKNYEYIL